MEKFLLEQYVAKKIIGPVDLDTAANTGARVDMKNVKRVTFLTNLGAGTTTAVHSFAFQQHLAATGGSPAVLPIDSPYYHKIGAATSFTKVTPPALADTFDLHALLGNSAALVAFEVLAEQLDRANGYEWVSLNIGDTGGAQLGAVVAIVETEFAPAYAIVL